MSRLKRELGVIDAVMMGMGSIIGTGIFVSMGVAAGVTGPSVVLAVAAGAAVALVNGFSSAELAANHPVSGGTYEYGYRRMHPALGFTAGWMFLIAKSASAATAALGIAGYLRTLGGFGMNLPGFAFPVIIVLLLTAVILRGIRLSSRVNMAIVTVTLLSLLFFVAAGIGTAMENGRTNFTPFFAAGNSGQGLRQQGWTPGDLLHAAALMFVSFTGYGRIATLGEEVRDPEKTIPRAIIITLFLVLALYLAVTAVAVASAGIPLLASSADSGSAPLVEAARRFRIPAAGAVLTAGAVAAMAGVLLNLLLGLSRVLLAMGRRADMPAVFGKLDRKGATPAPAVVAVSVLICLLTLTGNVRVTWSFSAFSVLVYYAITNLAALRLSPGERLVPPWIPALGLVVCLTLAFFLEPVYLAAGAGFIALGLAWFAVASFLRNSLA